MKPETLRKLAAIHARSESLWAVAALRVARLTEQQRMQELIEIYYENIRHEDISAEEILMELYPYTPPKEKQ